MLPLYRRLLLELADAVLQVGRVADALVLHFDDDIARRKPLVGRSRGRAGIDCGDFLIVRGEWHEHADAPHALRLPRTSRPRPRERPCDRRAAERGNDFPPGNGDGTEVAELLG